MLEYRLYLLDRDGHVCRAEELVCENDAAAMAQARVISAGQPAELWQYARVVGKIPGLQTATTQV